ncbi:hypothetical protein PhaeoP57_01770 [Phaeobacter inhibens]|nr:hypothetical protein PhaeoP51_01810 [Phaeobacter inhibens]AUQ82700.1 hypothetical protein PhaeoP57_01770 [Phaeobacter inhibens]AUQ90461.1 hypothetical protein PhaeoP24_01844 [Phaeobacter inhibens]
MIAAPGKRCEGLKSGSDQCFAKPASCALVTPVQPAASREAARPFRASASGKVTMEFCTSNIFGAAPLVYVHFGLAAISYTGNINSAHPLHPTKKGAAGAAPLHRHLSKNTHKCTNGGTRIARHVQPRRAARPTAACRLPAPDSCSLTADRSLPRRRSWPARPPRSCRGGSPAAPLIRPRCGCNGPP